MYNLRLKKQKLFKFYVKKQEINYFKQSEKYA